MAERNPPGFLQQRTDHDAELFRRATFSWAEPNSGGTSSVTSVGTTQRGGILVPPTSGTTQDKLNVRATSPASMAVTVGPGEALVYGGVASTNQGYYYVYNDATVTVPITASSNSSFRNDVIVLKVEDGAYSGSANQWEIAVVDGSVNGWPAQSDFPPNSLGIASVNVPAGAASITSANVHQLGVPQVARGGIAIARNQGEIPVAAHYGQPVWHTDSHLIEVYDTVAGTWTASAPLMHLDWMNLGGIVSYPGYIVLFNSPTVATMDYPFTMFSQFFGNVWGQLPGYAEFIIESPAGVPISNYIGQFDNQTVGLNSPFKQEFFSIGGLRTFSTGGMPSYRILTRGWDNNGNAQNINVTGSIMTWLLPITRNWGN